MIIPFPRRARRSFEGLRRERLVARRLWPELQRDSPVAVLAHLRASRAVPFWGLYARFLRESRRLVATSPLEARRHASVARALAVGLEASRSPSERWLEMAAQAAGIEAEVALGRPLIAERELDAVAESRLGVREPRLRAEFLRIEAVIDHELGRFPFAALRFEEAFLEVRFESSPLRKAHLLACRAVSLAAFDTHRAQSAFECVFEELRGVRATRLAAALHLAVVDLALDLGDHAKALSALNHACEAFSKQKRQLSETELLGLDWRRARVATAAQRPDAEDGLLEHVTRRFAATGNFRDQALATLDLSFSDLTRGEYRSAAARIDSLATRLAILGLHDEAVCSLMALREEISRPVRARTKVSATEAIREVRKYLLGWWWQPRHWEQRAASDLPPIGVITPPTRVPFSPIPSLPSTVCVDAEAYHTSGEMSLPPAVWGTDLSA